MVNQQECLKSSVQKNSLVSKFICSSYENGPKDGFRDTNWTFKGLSLGRTRTDRTVRSGRVHE